MIWIYVIVWVAIGLAVLIWIRKDNEFRHSDIADFYAFGSLIFWPLTAPGWLFGRPSEQVEDLSVKKTHQDFKNFMKTRKVSDGDFFKHLDLHKSDKTVEIGGDEPDFQDLHLEEIIGKKQWQEALRTANDMLRFSREQQEHSRVLAYERYIKVIKDKRRDDMGV